LFTNRKLSDKISVVSGLLGVTEGASQQNTSKLLYCRFGGENREIVSHWINQITLSEFRKHIPNVKEDLLYGRAELVWCGREGNFTQAFVGKSKEKYRLQGLGVN
jgi:hypothetical protein